MAFRFPRAHHHHGQQIGPFTVDADTPSPRRAEALMLVPVGDHDTTTGEPVWFGARVALSIDESTPFKWKVPLSDPEGPTSFSVATAERDGPVYGLLPILDRGGEVHVVEFVGLGTEPDGAGAYSAGVGVEWALTGLLGPEESELDRLSRLWKLMPSDERAIAEALLDLEMPDGWTAARYTRRDDCYECSGATTPGIGLWPDGATVPTDPDDETVPPVRLTVGSHGWGGTTGNGCWYHYDTAQEAVDDLTLPLETRVAAIGEGDYRYLEQPGRYAVKVLYLRPPGMPVAKPVEFEPWRGAVEHRDEGTISVPGHIHYKDDDGNEWYGRLDHGMWIREEPPA